jgi:hypothetical protein
MSLILGASDLLFSEIMRGVVIANLLWIGIGALVIIGGGAAIYFIERE